MNGHLNKTIIALALALAGCATPRLSIHRANQDGTGLIPAALPQMSLAIAAAYDGDAITYTATTTIEDSSSFYALDPERLQWTETRLAPTYWTNTSVIKTLGVETLDRRLALAQSVISVAGSLGADLTFDGEPTPCASSISAADLVRQMPEGVAGTPRAAPVAAPIAPAQRVATESAQDVAAASGAVHPACDVAFAFGAVPADAMTIAQFEAATGVNGASDGHWFGNRGRSRVIPYAACRAVDIAVSDPAVEESQRVLRVFASDPNFVRVALLPYHATMSFEQTCTPPAIQDPEGPAKTDMEVLAEILAEFRKPDAE